MTTLAGFLPFLGTKQGGFPLPAAGSSILRSSSTTACLMARRLSVPAARDWRLTALLMLACRSARETSLRQSTTTVDLAIRASCASTISIVGSTSITHVLTSGG
jgi:hypothetical protein